jgi:hypothetical protein
MLDKKYSLWYYPINWGGIVMCSKKILSKDEAYIYFGPYVELINRLIKEANDSYKDIPPLQRLMDSARTRSSSISDRILWNISHCKELLEDKQNIKIKRRYGVVRVLVKDKVQIVFKKLNKNLMPSRPSSPRSLNFQNQCDDVRKEFPELSDVERVTNLYWGYIWNPLGDPRIPIVCLDGSQLMWHFESTEITPVAKSIDATETLPPDNREKRIRPKGRQENKRITRGDINGEESSQN